MAIASPWITVPLEIFLLISHREWWEQTQFQLISAGTIVAFSVRSLIA